MDCEVLLRQGEEAFSAPVRLGEPCGVRPKNLSVPLTREWQSVRLKPCPAGEHRVNYTSAECLQCQPGKFKSGVGPALQCNLCAEGSYMGLPGAGACSMCPEHETTLAKGATEIVSCDCAPGFFRKENSTDWRLAMNHGICQPCPAGAICAAFQALISIDQTSMPLRNIYICSLNAFKCMFCALYVLEI